MAQETCSGHYRQKKGNSIRIKVAICNKLEKTADPKFNLNINFQTKIARSGIDLILRRV
jgi:hypothetical protein